MKVFIIVLLSACCGFCTANSSKREIPLITQAKLSKAPTTPTINIKAYGAKGDGITDDTRAIQNAINQASAKKVTLLIPTGNYKLSTFAPYHKLANGSSNVMNFFALYVNSPLTIISQKGSNFIFNNAVHVAGLKGGICSNATISISGLGFNVAGGGFFGRFINVSGTAVRPSKCTIKACTFVNAYTQVCLYNYCKGVSITGNKFLNTGTGSYGVLADDCRGLANVVISHNTFSGKGDCDAIELNNDGLISKTFDVLKAPYQPGDYTKNITISYNNITGYNTKNVSGGIGIGTAGPMSNLSISHNIINNCNYGIHCEYFRNTLPMLPLTNVTISNNTIRNITGLPAIHLMGVNSTHTSALSQILVTGNKITMLKTNPIAVQISKTNGAVVSNNTITLNVPQTYMPANRSTIGIYIGDADHITIKNNSISKFGIGFISSGGLNAGTANSLQNNNFKDCACSYYLDEFAGSVGNLMVTGNTHSNCTVVFDCPAGRNIILNAQNEKIGLRPLSVNVKYSHEANH